MSGSPDSYERPLGVVEALVAVRDQCPSGKMRTLAERALEEIATRRPGVLREQAAIVAAAIHGWRGDRARQVHAALTRFLESEPSNARD